jgi:hypothetical protein
MDIGISLVSRWNFAETALQGALSMGPFIISLLTVSPALALTW